MSKFKKILAAGALLFIFNQSKKANTKEISPCFGESGYQQTLQIATKNDLSLDLSAKSAYIIDYYSKTPVYAENEMERLPIASMCKIMTLILCFEAIDNGELTFDECLMVSEKAASMGGSQVFLEANGKYEVRELIKSIVVCSANDSCVALAERIAGSEELFTNKMNEKAKEIGATNTLFANCTGLPKEPQYSCAKDVAFMLKSLLSHDEYYEFGKVWLDKFEHPEGRYTEITNTNKLIRSYDGCDGGKTGFTNEAGFCLAATAKRNDMRIISVVIGEDSSAKRFEDVKTMFDCAFANYKNIPVVEANFPLEQNIKLEGGKIEEFSVYPQESAYIFARKGEACDVVTEMHIDKTRAPIQKGEKVGELLIFKDNVEINRVALLSANDVEKANFFDWLKKVAEHWNRS